MHNTLPFILFTGRGREEVVISAINNGADFYLQKGGDPTAQFAELAHKIRQAVLMRRTQMTIAEKEQRYLDLENSGDLIQSVTPGGRFLFVNQKWLDTLGYTEAELGDISLPDIIHEESREHCHDIFVRVIAGEHVGIIDAVFRKKTGEKVYVQGMASCRMADGKPQYTRAAFSDVTLRKQAEIELTQRNSELVSAISELKARGEELRRNYALLAAKEQALAASEAKLRLITDVSDDIIYMIDPGGTITYVSPRISRYGYRPEEVLSRNFREFIAHEDIPDSPWDLTAARTLQERRVTSVRIRDREGNLHWVEDNGAPVTDAAGNVIGITGILRDISARRKAEEALAESGKMFRAIFENSPYPIAINSIPDNRFIEVNRAFLDVSGYTAEEVIGRDPVSLGLLPVTEVAKLIAHRLRTGTIANVPLALTAKEGRRVHVLFSTMPLTINNQPAIVTVTAEVTKLKRIEEELLERNEDLSALNEELTVSGDEIRHKLGELQEKEEMIRKSEVKFRALVEHSLDGILITDFSGKILFLNRAAGLIAGVEEYEAVAGNRNVMEFIAPESRPDAIRDFANVAEGSDNYLALYRIVTAKGHERWVESVGNRIPFGDSMAVLISLRDITARKLAEEALQEANRKLNLLSGITRHDIKNQLLILDGFVALLQKKVPDPAVSGYFARIRATSTLIANLIQFTKEYEMVGVHAPAWQDVRTFAEDAGRHAGDGKIRLANDLPEGLEVYADPLIAKVFFNLVDNAVRHGGTVREVRFSLEQQDGERLIVCSDDGNGIPAEEKGLIFDRGFGKNTGFGLSLSREILDISGITIRETGTPGAGARFEIVVPEDRFRFRS